jgi:hypothetical protein
MVVNAHRLFDTACALGKFRSLAGGVPRQRHPAPRRGLDALTRAPQEPSRGRERVVVQHRERPHHIRQVHGVERVHVLARQPFEELHARVSARVESRRAAFLFLFSRESRKFREAMPRRGDVHGVHLAPLARHDGQKRVGCRSRRDEGPGRSSEAIVRSDASAKKTFGCAFGKNVSSEPIRGRCRRVRTVDALDDPLVDGDEAAHRARARRSVRAPARFAPGVGTRSAGEGLAPARGGRGVREVSGRGHRRRVRVPRGRARGA